MLTAIVEHPYLFLYFVIHLAGFAWLTLEVIHINRNGGPPANGRKNGEPNKPEDQPSRSDELLTIAQVAA